jgi:hypothetical protein
MERETGIEPATNSLEGCDSTTELLPPTRLATSVSSPYDGQARQPPRYQTAPSRTAHRHRGAARSATCRQTDRGGDLPTNLLHRRVQPSARRRKKHPRRRAQRDLPPNGQGRGPPRQPSSSARPTFGAPAQKKVGGEGRVRTSVARRRQVYSLLRLTALPPPRIVASLDGLGNQTSGLSEHQASCLLPLLSPGA